MNEPNDLEEGDWLIDTLARVQRHGSRAYQLLAEAMGVADEGVASRAAGTSRLEVIEALMQHRPIRDQIRAEYEAWEIAARDLRVGIMRELVAEGWSMHDLAEMFHISRQQAARVFGDGSDRMHRFTYGEG